MQNTDITESLPIATGIGFPIDLTCNLQCLGCNAGSNLGIKDSFNDEQRLGWINNLASLFERLNIHSESIEVVGGEPFLHRNLSGIIGHIHSRIPQSRIHIFTNGLLLHKQATVLAELRQFDPLMVVSVHDSDKDHTNKIVSGLLRLRENGIEYRIKNMTGEDLPVELGGKSRRDWVIPHPEDENGKIHPANESKYIRSWTACTYKTCMHLYDNSVWKCGPLANLSNMLKHRGQLDHPEWQSYLAYQPLRLDDSNLDYDTVLEFFGRGAEPICSMCPAQNRFYSGKPVYRRYYDTFDPKKFHHKIGR